MSIASAKSQRPQARSPWGNSDYLPFIAAEVPICTGWNLHVCSNFQDGTIPSAPVWTQGLPTLEESNLPGSIQGLYYMDSWWISATCTIYIYIYILTVADEFHMFSWSCFLGVLNYVSILKHLQLQTVGMIGWFSPYGQPDICPRRKGVLVRLAGHDLRLPLLLDDSAFEMWFFGCVS